MSVSLLLFLRPAPSSLWRRTLYSDVFPLLSPVRLLLVWSAKSLSTYTELLLMSSLVYFFSELPLIPKISRFLPFLKLYAATPQTSANLTSPKISSHGAPVFFFFLGSPGLSHFPIGSSNAVRSPTFSPAFLFTTFKEATPLTPSLLNTRYVTFLCC